MMVVEWTIRARTAKQSQGLSWYRADWRDTLRDATSCIVLRMTSMPRDQVLASIFTSSGKGLAWFKLLNDCTIITMSLARSTLGTVYQELEGRIERCMVESFAGHLRILRYASCSSSK
jgi:hypothetical protein